MNRNVPGQNAFGPYPIETGGTVALFLSRPRAIYQLLQFDEEGLQLISIINRDYLARRKEMILQQI